MGSRVDRIVLALEIAIGVVPVTIVGGLYSILGLYFGGVALAISVWQRAGGASAWWLGVLALAAGGCAGLIGLWAIVLASASARTPSDPVVRAAFTGSGIGLVTAVVAVMLLLRGSSLPPGWLLGVLVAPILVVLHRLPIIALRSPRR